jgi:hypothetical protein
VSEPNPSTLICITGDNVIVKIHLRKSEVKHVSKEPYLTHLYFLFGFRTIMVPMGIPPSLNLLVQII